MRIPVIAGILLLLFSVSLVKADGPTFDAASVKIADASVRPPWINSGGPGTSDPGHFRAPHIQLFNLLAIAFGVSTDQLSCPAWIRDVVSANDFTITATMSVDTTKEQFQKMLENLLVERFHLVFHRETRNFPRYELVVDKGGPKFREVNATPQDGVTASDMRAVMSAPRGNDGFPIVPGPRTMNEPDGVGMKKTKYQERTMTEFIFNLGYLVGSLQGKSVLDGYPQPRVVDKTGLTGKYTFILEYSDTSNLQGNTSEPVASGPNIFKAIQSEMGLRLDKTADVPVDMVVIESVDKVPTDN